MGEDLDEAQSDLIVESTGLDHEQIDSLKKGFDGFDKVSSLPSTADTYLM